MQISLTGQLEEKVGKKAYPPYEKRLNLSRQFFRITGITARR